MRERTGNRHLAWISGLLLFIITGGLIWKYPPGTVHVEGGVILFVGLGTWLLALPFTGKKIAGLIAVGLVGGLVMSRLGILEPLTLLLLVVILVGIGSV